MAKGDFRLSDVVLDDTIGRSTPDVEHERAVAIFDLIEENIHVALRVGRLPDSQLIARKLSDVRMVVCASPDYLERRGLPQTPEPGRAVVPLSQNRQGG